MPKSVCRAQPPLAFMPQALNLGVLRTVQFLLPMWLRWQLGIRRIQVNNPERLVELYEKFQAGKARFLIAFRHPSTDDPFCMAYLLGKAVPKAAWRMGISLRQPVHSYFLYDRGIPLWAGALVGWFFPRMGGSSIFRGKLDLPGLRAARDLLVNGKFPLAAAPEGGTNDHSELVSPLEPGLAQIGFWGAEDLQAAGRTEEVWIVPICIQYQFVHPPWQGLSQLLTQLETDAGIPSHVSIAGHVTSPVTATPLRATPLSPTSASANQTEQLYQRILALADRLLAGLEEFYRVSYGQTFPDPTAAQPEDEQNSQRMSRLHRLLETALQVAESYFGIKSKGDFVERCRRLEQAAWDRIYREDLAQLSPLQRGLADWTAQEASLRLWHMRLVERFTAITGNYIQQKPSAERFAEVLLILYKVVTWLKGNDPNLAIKLGQRQVKLSVGQPISVSQRFPRYQQDRRSARQQVSELTAELQAALEAMID